jgi:hypothetical protein
MKKETAKDATAVEIKRSLVAIASLLAISSTF